jgi:UDP-3-O-[3-hydroxymyristoyl] glucosamine N-acyltransferase
VSDWGLAEIIVGNGSAPAYAVEGDASRRVSGVASLAEATAADLAFCSLDLDRAASAVAGSRAGIILCRPDMRGRVHAHDGGLLVFIENPRQAFVRFAGRLTSRADEGGGVPVIAASAVVAPDAKLGRNCRIGNFVVIGEGCSLGDNTVLHDRVTLVANCRIGANCVIQSGVTLGEDGFAYEREPGVRLEKFPHFKGVVIGDNVEIYANTNIARGSLSDPVIGDGTKVDAMVHIAHNARIGMNCMLTAGTTIGGSVTIGDSCWTGLNSTVKHQVTIGNNVIVGAGACVLHDVPDGDVVAGVPAKSIKDRVSTPDVFLMAGQEPRG